MVDLVVLEHGAIQDVLEPRLEMAVQIREGEHGIVFVARDVAVPLENHAVLRQRPGLVGAEDVHRPEILDGVQALHDDLLPRHRERAPREAHRDDHRQQLGREADGDRQGEEEGLLPIVLGEPVDHEDEGHHDGDEADHEPGEARHALVEGGLDRRSREGAGDAAEIRPGTGLDDHGGGRPALHRGAEEAQVLLLERRAVAPLPRRLELLDGKRLAGEARLRDEEVAAGEDADVGRNHISRAQVHDVARDEPGERLLDRPAGTHDRRGEADHRAELLRRRVGPRLLREAQADAEHDHDGHDGGGADVTRREGDDGEDGQEQDQGVQARPQQQTETRVTFVARHDVRSVLLEAARSLLVREALRRASEPLEGNGWLGLGELREKRGNPDRGGDVPRCTAEVPGQHRRASSTSAAARQPA